MEKSIFEVKRWSITYFQGPFEDCPEHDEFLTLFKSANYIEDVILKKAVEYGITSIELTGRPGEGGIDADWLINYDRYPVIKSQRDNSRVDKRRMLVNRVCGKACEKGLDVYLWSHEPYFPEEFYKPYTELAGIDYPICMSNELVMKFIRDKYSELFEKMPLVKGIVLSVNECGLLNILTDEGCRCEKCRIIPIEDKIRILLENIIEICEKNGKQLIVRTFTAARYKELGRHTETERILKAFSKLPENLVIMSKYCPADFYFLDGVDDPLIGAFKNRHIVEFTLVREWFGITHIPLNTPKDYIKRFRNMQEKKCIGAVGRTDFPMIVDQPVMNIGHFNEFNILAFSELLKNPDIGEDEIWEKWSGNNFKGIAASDIKYIFGRTEEAAAKIFNVLGTEAVNYHSTISNFRDSYRNMWALNRGKWEKEFVSTALRMLEPDEEIIRVIVAEKEEGIKILEESLSRLESIKEKLDEMKYIEMKHYFEKFRDAARYWKEMTRCFFVSLAAEKDSKMLGYLFECCATALKEVKILRKRNGENSWPTVPIGVRGTKGEDFVLQCFRSHLYRVLGLKEPYIVLRRLGDEDCESVKPVPEEGIERLLRYLYGLERLPAKADGIYGILTFQNVEVKIEDTVISINGNKGDLAIPLFYECGVNVTLKEGTYKYYLENEKLLFENT